MEKVWRLFAIAFTKACFSAPEKTLHSEFQTRLCKGTDMRDRHREYIHLINTEGFQSLTPINKILC